MEITATRGQHRLRDAAIMQAYLRGAALRSVAEGFGLSHERIRQVLRREGVKLRPRSRAKR